jgi:hypothetical protein
MKLSSGIVVSVVIGIGLLGVAAFGYGLYCPTAVFEINYERGEVRSKKTFLYYIPVGSWNYTKLDLFAELERRRPNYEFGHTGKWLSIGHSSCSIRDGGGWHDRKYFKNFYHEELLNSDITIDGLLNWIDCDMS